MRSGPPAGGSWDEALVWFFSGQGQQAETEGEDIAWWALTGHGRALQWAQLKKVLLLPTAQDRS